MATLAEIRAKLLAQDNRSNNSRAGDGATYPFWDLEAGKESSVRFVPDGDANNTFFWVERAMIKLPFAGVKGETDTRPVVVQVPCMEMYGETCPVLAEVRPWFKDPSLEELGRKYWKKRSYLFQGFVTDDGLKEESAPENPIRRFVLGQQIFQTVKGALVDPELEELPTDYVHGVDFKIVKTTKGGYADYSTSKWSRRERPLTDEELAAIDKFGLANLRDFLPKKPTAAEVEIIREMFRASVDGEPYDPEAWGAYFRPAGMAAPAGATRDASVKETAKPATPAPRPAAPAPTPAPAATDDTPPFDVDDEPAPAPAAAPAAPAAASTGSKAEDILALIRARQKSA